MDNNVTDSQPSHRGSAWNFARYGNYAFKSGETISENLEVLAVTNLNMTYLLLF